MKITKLYQQDRYLREWDAVVTSVRRGNNNCLIITLDKTAFFPEGGGQSCDMGYLGGLSVTDVQEEAEQIYHTVSLPAENSNTSDSQEIIAAGKTVKCTLDWDRRFDNMQRHCGEHILSGVFYELFGGVNRGFHMGEEYMTIDISLEEERESMKGIDEITFDMAMEAEKKANEVIWSDAPVTVMHFDERSQAEKLPLRKALAFDEDISIVCVGSPENASDCVACCGTHPSTAGQVGIIKIYKVEKYKSMFRIYFEAGARALKDYDFKHSMLTSLSGRFSSSVEDFPLKLKAQEEKLKAVKDELFHLKKAYINNECEKLDNIISSSCSNEQKPAVILYPLPHLSIDDAFEMGKKYMGSCPHLLMLYSEKNTSFVLVSDGDPDCGALVKEYASFYKGKGGGSKVSARAIFKTDEDAALFAKLIENHLK